MTAPAYTTESKLVYMIDAKSVSNLLFLLFSRPISSDPPMLQLYQMISCFQNVFFTHAFISVFAL